VESHKTTGIAGSLALMDASEHLASLSSAGYGFSELFDECAQYGWIVVLATGEKNDYHLVVKQGQRELPGMRFRSPKILATITSSNLTGCRLDVSARRLRVRMTAFGLFTPDVAIDQAPEDSLG
jgi:hypothetical protein